MENIGKDRWLICIALLGHFIRMKSTSKYYFCILKLAGSGFKSIQRKILKFKKNPSPAQILILAQGEKFLIKHERNPFGDSKGLWPMSMHV